MLLFLYSNVKMCEKNCESGAPKHKAQKLKEKRNREPLQMVPKFSFKSFAAFPSQLVSRRQQFDNKLMALASASIAEYHATSNEPAPAITDGWFLLCTYPTGPSASTTSTTSKHLV